MKIRNSFVSNSSSSSFVIIVPKSQYKAFLESLDPFGQATVEDGKVVGSVFEEVTIDGRKLMIWVDSASSEEYDWDLSITKRAIEIAEEQGVDLGYDPADDDDGDIGQERAWCALTDIQRAAQDNGGYAQEV